MYVKGNRGLTGLDRLGWSAVYSVSSASSPILASRIRPTLPPCTSTRREKQTSKSSDWLPAFSSAVRQIHTVPGATALQSRSLPRAGHSLFRGNRVDDTAATHKAA